MTWASDAYWSSLTIVDPIVAALLFARPKLVVLSTIVLNTTNVVHNLAVTALQAADDEFLTRVGSIVWAHRLRTIDRCSDNLDRQSYPSSLLIADFNETPSATHPRLWAFQSTG